jgi:hypothetical protein
MKNPNDNIGNRIRDLQPCSAVPQLNALSRIRMEYILYEYMTNNKALSTFNNGNFSDESSIYSTGENLALFFTTLHIIQFIIIIIIVIMSFLNLLFVHLRQLL